MDNHHSDEIEALGATTFREQRRAFGIRPKDRRHHIYIIGKTGTGKSTLIKNMVIQDLRYNHGVALIDPHGDLVEDLLNFIPKNRTNEVVYFNPADKENPVGSEARKYRLNLTITHQYLYQLPEAIKHAVFGNVGTIIAFRSGF